ncbi:TetR/AcrR family transcriptional regulator [Streptomyces beijiangensis]|uniref:TetR/AcrR family transcriptional regulator n=1 Tax=Streptomyces beijiangensis TaxID=163361 RepID=A0A939F2W0_9ACTN|nr:TetR family transcriptional regulator [Streptomyces beijiangensis]MBO0510853.1 TetR/AcrR family transcriptional regulator [Streptomyces beijiangensis]
MTDGQADAPPLGRRERKKQEMRAHISGVATLMFMARGFDAVTVAEIAEAADVSAMTVFNYFPRKENLYLDRGPEIVAVLTDAVRDRAEDEPPLASLRRRTLQLIDDRHPLSGVVDSMGLFLQVVIDSPALSARWREMSEEAIAALAEVLAAAAGRTPYDPEVRYVAASVQTIRDTLTREAARRTASGERADAIHPGIRALADRLFDVLERGTGPDWGTAVRPHKDIASL